MTKKEHLRKVTGRKGGQRPGVYQFDLTPSMISLLQRAWDQNPKKRPTMESVGRNLQLILKELETLIKDEQRTLLKAAGGTEEAVAAFCFQGRTRGKKGQAKSRKRATTKTETKSEKHKKTFHDQFDEEKNPTGCSPEIDIETVMLGRASWSRQMGFWGLCPLCLTCPTCPRPSLSQIWEIPLLAVANVANRLADRPADRPSTTEIDFDALEYEVWSSADEEEEEQSISSEEESCAGASSMDHTDKVVTVDNSAKEESDNPDVFAANDDEAANRDPSDADPSEDADIIGDAISNMRQQKVGSKILAKPGSQLE